MSKVANCVCAFGVCVCVIRQPVQKILKGKALVFEGGHNSRCDAAQEVMPILAGCYVESFRHCC
ncbi:MAG: hypothetical protein KME52_18445 [Desmonostoc geniculatum HA4340-LM1]|nr:hypothetical protein [Desmonostoc geniculatum HA4340-LM1]